MSFDACGLGRQAPVDANASVAAHPYPRVENGRCLVMAVWSRRARLHRLVSVQVNLGGTGLHLPFRSRCLHVGEVGFVVDGFGFKVKSLLMLSVLYTILIRFISSGWRCGPTPFPSRAQACAVEYVNSEGLRDKNYVRVNPTAPSTLLPHPPSPAHHAFFSSPPSAIIFFSALQGPGAHGGVRPAGECGL